MCGGLFQLLLYFIDFAIGWGSCYGCCAWGEVQKGLAVQLESFPLPMHVLVCSISYTTSRRRCGRSLVWSRTMLCGVWTLLCPLQRTGNHCRCKVVSCKCSIYLRSDFLFTEFGQLCCFSPSSLVCHGYYGNSCQYYVGLFSLAPEEVLKCSVHFSFCQASLKYRFLVWFTLAHKLNCNHIITGLKRLTNQLLSPERCMTSLLIRMMSWDSVQEMSWYDSLSDAACSWASLLFLSDVPLQVLAPRQLQSGWVLAGKDRKSGYVDICSHPPTHYQVYESLLAPFAVH